jgi:hypothetical protein
MASPKRPESSQSVTLHSIVAFLLSFLGVHEDLCHPKVWQSMAKTDSMGQFYWISAIFLYITVTYGLKHLCVFPRSHNGRTPPRKMLRVKDGQEVDVISDASEVEDGHKKKRRQDCSHPL